MTPGGAAIEWHRTPHGEWICDRLSMFAVRRAEGWFLYAFGASESRAGPFETLADAQRAAQRARNTAPSAARA